MPFSPFDRSTMPPHVFGAREIFGSQTVPLSRRREIWSQVGTKPALEMIARLFAQLDLSVIEQRWEHVERGWCRDLQGDLGSNVRREVERGNLLLSQAGLMQCIKEIIELSNPTSESETSKGDFVLCLLGINSDVEMAGIDSPETWEELENQSVVAEAASASMNHNDTIETLTPVAEATWLRPWSDDLTGTTLIEDLGTGPSDVFAEVMGIDIEDFFAIGWIILKMCKEDEVVSFNEEMLREHGLGDHAIKVFLKNCTATLDQHRRHLADSRAVADSNPWTRYRLQQTPFVRFDDGTITVLRLQNVLQRFFGDHPFLQVDFLLRQRDPLRQKHFEGAMKHMFELRVGEVLNKISKVKKYRRKVAILNEPTMKRAWTDSSGNHPQLCDWGFATNEHCILIDANFRLLKQVFAEGTATIEEFDNELTEMYSEGKFQQLLSAVSELHNRGWKQKPIVITEATQFIPLVVVPDDGVPTTWLIEARMFRSSVEMTRPYAGVALPPAIIHWRELLVIEGLAEIRDVDVFELLIRWRFVPKIYNTLQVPFLRFVETMTPYDQPMPRRIQRAGREFALRMNRHVESLKAAA
ncbi:hypothetical protein EEB14_35850 [Rhodococcus sp. WS4]|nr:hypothetical protein EEB14_35850 [Rhodococcus sp. WS4]